MSSPPRVAIVGAGMAGLSCATALQEAGCQVTVFDKSRGPGGRMSTRRGPGWQCDHGAKYFMAHDPDFRTQVAQWEAAGVAARWQPVLRRFGPDAGSLDETAACFVGTPQMTAPAQWLASTVALHAGVQINAIARDAAGWQLHGAGVALPGHRYDVLVLAVPAPQVGPLLGTLAPLQAAVAASATMQGCWAMMLQYQAPLALGFDAAVIGAGPLCWAAREQAKPGRPGGESWVLHASAAWSEAHLELDVDSVAASMLAAFASVGGPAPQHWSAHRWRYASTLQAHSETCTWEAGKGLGLCGDWLGGGTVEAAWLSGRALARRIASS